MLFSDILVQVYLVFYTIWLLYPEINSPPLSYLSAFFLTTDIMMLALLLVFLIILKGVERELGTNNYILIYFSAAIAGNLGLLSIHFGTPEIMPVMGASGGIFGIFGAFIVKHPYELVVADGLPLIAILAFALLTIGHVVLFGKLDFLPIIIGAVYGYALKKRQPSQPMQPPYAYGRY